MSTTDAGDPKSFDASDFHAGQAQADGDRLVAVCAADARFAAAHLATLDATDQFVDHGTRGRPEPLLNSRQSPAQC
ncbi:hypothetical protein [Kutzneria chonburiensis]|uniref:Uncharacterized protein n=1 Tax=Kutzneria chonburiensis TaxID=1483604 RepID=A0ABV6MQN7_9PSEU|nr:hypothetical protein [Kutzneria chonburiensis]